jgi:fermentation-respiration switch protein FrsA (DUF1100 family)
MLRLLHLLIVAVYVLIPLAALVRVLIARWRQKTDGPRAGSLAVTFIAGFGIALVLCLVYGRALNGHVPARQVLLATWFATGLLLILRCFDVILLWTLRRLAGIHRPADPAMSAAGHLGRAIQSMTVMLARALILFAVGLPFVMAAVMTYRPKVEPKDNPLTQLGFSFQRVEFESADGIKLVGWWIPAMETPRARRWAQAGRETVIVCHGLAASKSNQLILARQLVPGGFNVLAFDFRAHGESGGQITGYGALEKQDVLAAVKWVRDAHPEQSERIFGVGASMGAVALLAAAADDSPEGRSIRAIATYAAYDNLPKLVHDLAGDHFRPPLGWLVEKLGMPIASAHAGVNLSSWAPDQFISQVWPRPVLFIHGEQDEIISFERGQALFDAAPQPKYHVWYPEGSHNDIVSNESAARIVLEFLKMAAPLPVI